jgi:hypothetical protein
MKYEFDPTKFGFLPPKKMPKDLKEVEAKYAFVKVICISGKNDGTFWYTSCHKIADGDDRWRFSSGLFDVSRADQYDGGHTRHSIYSGLISSDEYAKELLKHLLGTTRNESVVTDGAERLEAASLKIPRKKRKK